jgi:hypothetical protein
LKSPHRRVENVPGGEVGGTHLYAVSATGTGIGGENRVEPAPDIHHIMPMAYLMAKLRTEKRRDM